LELSCCEPRSKHVERAVIKVLGDKLREQIPTPETKTSKELRRLIVELERREREEKGKPH
jgi:hypothetical protein